MVRPGRRLKPGDSVSFGENFVAHILDYGEDGTRIVEFEYEGIFMERLEELGLRVECDVRNEKIGKKLREARNERVSYMCVIGEKEAEAGSVTVRSGKEGELGEMSVEDFADKLLAEIAVKAM